ncbi:Variant surface glycoprotein [Trypanosoma congolense IL3000]|uniref:Variant surface glycoprotein n=1 Tax=Trypanosoma congolense (strain IL3000) TaxID=1068625 RepID=F9W8B2_TRYCI|nr:Variant surface glycoprotein [Trypanosoma congolense IL3000]
MMLIQFWKIIIVSMWVSANVEGTDHNHDAHNALCELLQSAVGKWGDGGKGLSEPLSKALNRTIFGNESGGDIAELRSKLPEFYDEVLKGRGTRFGPCGGRESGQSAPYDMVCLCTLGDGGWPLNDTQTATTLCGQPEAALEGGKDKKGWSERGTGLDQITATWFNVTKHCLEGDKEKGETLKEALGNVLGKLENKPYGGYNRYQLGEGTPTEWSACTGYPPLGVCVMYYNSTKITKTMPWWTDLQNAIPEEEKFQEEKKKREEEEKSQKQDSSSIPGENSTLSRRRRAVPDSPNENEADSNLTAKFEKLQSRSSTPIIPPPSWLFRAVLLI